MYSKIIVDERVKKNGIDLWIDKLKMFIMIDRFASLLTLNVCDSRAIFLHISPQKKQRKLSKSFVTLSTVDRVNNQFLHINNQYICVWVSCFPLTHSLSTHTHIDEHTCSIWGTHHVAWYRTECVYIVTIAESDFMRGMSNFRILVPHSLSDQ